MNALLRVASLSVALAAIVNARPSAQTDTVDAVLARAGAYVADFHRQLSSIVAEERYVQDVKAFAKGPGRLTMPMRTELLSDLLLVKPGGEASWMEFRDVFEVDGRPIRERNERLLKMFLEPSPSAAGQISRILNESARFNIGDIQRNVNTPIFPLQFLEAANQPRFKFKQTSDRRPKTLTAAAPADAAFRVSTEVWVIAYDEKQSGTMIKTARMKDLPSRGRFWIEPASGRVLMSELIAENREVRATIDVSFQSEPLLGLLVPVEMRERYARNQTHSLVEGRATYGKFRQFQVNTDEKFLLKK